MGSVSVRDVCTCVFEAGTAVLVNVVDRMGKSPQKRWELDWSLTSNGSPRGGAEEL